MTPSLSDKALAKAKAIVSESLNLRSTDLNFMSMLGVSIFLFIKGVRDVETMETHIRDSLSDIEISEEDKLALILAVFVCIEDEIFYLDFTVASKHCNCDLEAVKELYSRLKRPGITYMSN